MTSRIKKNQDKIFHIEIIRIKKNSYEIFVIEK